MNTNEKQITAQVLKSAGITIDNSEESKRIFDLVLFLITNTTLTEQQLIKNN